MKETLQSNHTMSGLISKAILDEYTEHFSVSGEILTDENGIVEYKPHQVKINNYIRLKGHTNPADNTILYLIETSDGKKGILTYSFDAFSDARVFNFIQALVDHQMKCA